MEPTVRQAKLDALTGLRYLAAMTVVFSHVSANEPLLDLPMVRNASTVGMPLFFTLSGFLMCYNYYADFAERRRGALWRFYVARFARIYPVYLLVLLISFSFMGNFFHDLENKPDETWHCLRYCGTLTQSWVFEPVFIGDHNPRILCQSYLGVAWSVSTEMFFYATFPLVIPVLKRLTSARAIFLTGAGLWLAWAITDLAICPRNGTTAGLGGDSSERWFLYLSPYGRIGEFWIGCLTGRLFGLFADGAPGLWERRIGSLATWGCFPAFAAFTLISMTNWLLNRLHYNVGLAPVCAVLIYCLARYPSLPRRLLGAPLLVLLGESSYCLFLLHPLFQSFYHPRAQGEGELKMWYVVTFNHAALFIMLHVSSLGIYRYYELPLRSWIRDRLIPRGRSVPLAAPDAAPSRPLRRAA